MTQQSAISNKSLLGFSLFPGIGQQRFSQLLKIFDSPEHAWNAGPDKLKKSALPKSLTERFLKFRKSVDLDAYLHKLQREEVDFLDYFSSEYPKFLKEISSPPLGLFIKGKIKKEDEQALAVIGSRRMTEYGSQAGKKLVPPLVKAGFTIVSGLARGCDGLAHRLALGNGGRTIAVLGSGVDVIYPPEHESLARRIVQSGRGAVISEFPLGTKPKKGHFPARNRIVSGLSRGVLVLEGSARSGTKNTTKWAADQGREVFAVPGPITSKMSQAPADLIQLGAKLVTDVEDILEELRY